MRSNFSPRLTLAFSTFLLGGVPALAQSLAVTNGAVVTYSGDLVPDSSGTPLLGYTFALTGFDNPALDDSGRIFFRAQMSGPSLTPVNNTAYFFGSSRANLKMGPRGGDQAPGLPAGVLLQNGGGTSTGLMSAVRLAPNGNLWWASNTWDGTNSGNYLFGGPFGAQSPFEFQGDNAPGTLETFAQTFVGISQSTSGLNRNGRIFFHGSLTGPIPNHYAAP